MKGDRCPLNTGRWCPLYSEKCLELQGLRLHCVLYKQVFFLEEKDKKAPARQHSVPVCPQDRRYYCPLCSDADCDEKSGICILWYRIT